MATAILAAPSYQLPQKARQAIFSQAQNQDRKIPQNIMLLIERQRQNFIQEYGNDGTEQHT